MPGTAAALSSGAIPPPTHASTQICPLLHSFLATQFPDEYAERRRETEEQEADEEAGSPEPPPPSEPPPSAHPPAWQPRHFRCDHPACGQLLCRPVVLNCGHVVCSACRPRGSDSAACPACGAPQPVEPSVCRALDSLLMHLFPADQAARVADSSVACVGAAPTAVAMAEPPEMGERGDGDGDSDGGRSQPSTPRMQQQHASGVPEPSSPPASGPSDQQQQQLSPSLQRAIGRGRVAGGERAGSTAAVAERSLLEITEENYTHHGVGCDACGLYPIVGRWGWLK